jgi:hypothetical protein
MDDKGAGQMTSFLDHARTGCHGVLYPRILPSRISRDLSSKSPSLWRIRFNLGANRWKGLALYEDSEIGQAQL